MKTLRPAIATIARKVLQPHAPGGSRHKQAAEGRSQPGPSSVASGEIESLRGSRSTRSDDEGAAPAPRNAQLPGASSASIGGGTPAASSRWDGSASPGTPTEGLSSKDAFAHANDVISQIEAASGKLPADRIPLPEFPETSTPASPSSAATRRVQEAGSQNDPAQILAAHAGKLAVRPPDTSGTPDFHSRLNALRRKPDPFTPVPESQPLPSTDRSEHAKKRVEYFDAMLNLILERAEDGRIKMGDVDHDEMRELIRFSKELGECAAVSDFTSEGARSLHEVDMAKRENSGLSALERLLHNHLSALLPAIKDPDTLVQLANDLLKPLEGPARIQASSAVPPAGTNDRSELVAPIRADIELAKAEIHLQYKLLALLGGAVMACGEGKIDGLRGGLNHLLRQLLHKQVVEKGGVNPLPRGEQVRDSIHTHLGAHFSVGVSTKNKDELALSVKRSSVGSVTIADLEAGLSKLLQLETPKFIPLAIRAAVEKTEEFELIKKEGQQHVSLTEPAQQRLHAMRLATLGGAKALPAQPSAKTSATHRTIGPVIVDLLHQIEHLSMLHGSHGTGLHQEALAQTTNTLHAVAHLTDMPPQQRLAQAATQAIHTVQFVALKQSLKRTFDDAINRDMVGKAADQTLNWVHPHPGLKQEKADLMVETLKKVMGSHTTKDMLDHLTEAEQKHRDILLRRDHPHGGGQTAEMLKDLRSAIERFQTPPVLAGTAGSPSLAAGAAAPQGGGVNQAARDGVA